jgi:hypothetical protein
MYTYICEVDVSCKKIIHRDKYTAQILGLNLQRQRDYRTRKRICIVKVLCDKFPFQNAVFFIVTAANAFSRQVPEELNTKQRMCKRQLRPLSSYISGYLLLTFTATALLIGRGFA